MREYRLSKINLSLYNVNVGKNRHFIYKITNKIDGKVYIGQSFNPAYRWYRHKYNSICYSETQLIAKSLRKFGIQNFKFEVIAGCIGKNNTNLTEEYYIALFDSTNINKGYNVYANTNVVARSSEIFKKISESLKIFYQSNNSWLKGKNLSEKWKENISKASMGKLGTNTGKILTPEWRANISKALVGKSLSNQHIASLSKSHLGLSASNRKITFKMAEELRQEYKNNKITQKQLGIKYGLSQATVCQIVHNKTYNNGK